jgi:hypothetical protein
MSEGVARQLGNHDLNAVFPGFNNSPQAFLQYLG